MSGSLKKRTFKSLIWNAVERFATAGMGFAFGVVLARILSPADYGTIAMLGVFTALCQCFIDSGFLSALVRKTNRTAVDDATAFYFNLVVSVVCYFLLFFAAPFIADFYESPILTPITRLISLNLIISALCIVPRATLIAKLDFRTQAMISIIGLLVTGPLGIYLAWKGFGVWTLVWQSIAGSVVSLMLMWGYTRWVPRAWFSYASFRELFSFGSKLLATRVIGTIYGNIYTIVIGKCFSPASLGYYGRASHMASMPSAYLNGILQSVSFPVLCTIQDDDERLALNYRKFLRLSAFIVFPLMVGLAAVAEPFIILLLTEKWAPCVPLLQIICFALMWYPVHSINLTLLEVKGRSDLFLVLDIYKKIIGVVILCVTIPMGLVAMCAGQVLSSLISLVLNTHYTGKLIHLGLWRQMCDYVPILLNCLVMGGVAYAAQWAVPGDACKLLAGVAAGGTYYILSNFLLQTAEWKDALDFVRNR